MRLRSIALFVVAASISFAFVAGEARADDAKKLMVNFKVGPSFGVAGDPDLGTQVALELDGGYAIIEHGWLTFSPQFQLGGDVANALVLPIGFQYDIEIAEHLFVYPRFGVGWGHAFSRSFFGFSAPDQNAFVILPEAGIKYVAKDTFNVGFEPFSLPIGVGCDACVSVSYRLLFYAGAQF